jgi:hypothetical protein
MRGVHVQARLWLEVANAVTNSSCGQLVASLDAVLQEVQQA